MAWPVEAAVDRIA